MHVLEIANPDGTTTSVSLRRSEANETDHGYVRPDHMARDFHILQVIEKTGLPAPRPILLDETGEHFGVAAMLLSHLPGKPAMKSRNLSKWSEELARGIAEVHAIGSDRVDISSLRPYMRDAIRDNLANWRDDMQSDALAARSCAALEEAIDHIDFGAFALIHGDYWPGNILWQRGRLTGIVDWSNASLGDPRIDLAECRMALVFSHSAAVADEFAEHYEHLTGRALNDLWFFDLYRCLWPLIETEHYLEGAHDLGQTHLELSDVDPRLRAFVKCALQQATNR